MSQLVTIKQTVVELDGFDDYTDAGSEEGIDTSSRVIIGEKLKFNDPRWLINEDPKDVSGMLLTVLGLRKVVTKWSVDGLPLETHILAPNTDWPKFAELNAKCDRSEWRPWRFSKEPDGKVGPWSGQQCLYLYDENMTRYTWPARLDTGGACVCIRELVEDIQLYRKYRGDDACPVVKLSHKLFSAQFNRNRPHLPAQRWVSRSAQIEKLEAASEPLLSQNTGAPADAKPVEPVTLQEEMGDKVPW
jgi:hypothetical protein